MKIPGTTHTFQPASNAAAAPQSGLEQIGFSHDLTKTSAAAEISKVEGKKEKQKEEAPTVSSRQLVEVQGNPAATAANAAKVSRELSPPKNPYPSVQELATIRRAQAMEKAAKAELKGDAEMLDRRV